MPPYFIVLLTEGFVFLEYQRQHSYLEAKYCKCVYFLHNLVFSNSSERQRLFFHYLLIAGPWLRCISQDSVEILLEFVCILVYFQRHSRDCFIIVCFVYSCIEVIIPNPLLWVASQITAHVFAFHFPSLFTGKLSITTFVLNRFTCKTLKCIAVLKVREF